MYSKQSQQSQQSHQIQFQGHQYIGYNEVPGYRRIATTATTDGQTFEPSAPALSPRLVLAHPVPPSLAYSSHPMNPMHAYAVPPHAPDVDESFRLTNPDPYTVYMPAVDQQTTLTRHTCCTRCDRESTLWAIYAVVVIIMGVSAFVAIWMVSSIQ